VGFLVSSSFEVFNTRSCKKGRIVKCNTTKRTIQLLQFGKGGRAGWFCLAGRIWPAVRRLPTPVLEGTLVVATSLAVGESDHQFRAWLQKN